MNSVVFSKAIIFRNLKDYKFSHKLTIEQKQEIANKILSVIGSEYALLNISTIDANMLKYLRENALINNNSTTILLNKTNNICIDLFNTEHINIVATSVGANEDVFKNAKQLADLLANKLPLMYSDEYGYLTSDLTKLGAGVRLETDICLDTICSLNKIEQVKQNIAKLGYTLKETNIKSIYRMSTNCVLGFGETEVYEEFTKTLTKLQELEVESAKMLDVSSHDEIYDKILRSNAILHAAHLINYEELTTILIILRTGVNLGFVNLTTNQLNGIQKLVLNKNLSMISKAECKDLASNLQKVLKGE